MSKNRSRTDKFLLNVSTSALLQLVTIITGLITPRLMLEYFGSEINGLTTSIHQYISYISLVEAGLSNAAVYALYKPLATGDIAARDSVISATRISYRNTGFLFTGLSVLLAAVYPFIVKNNALSYEKTFLLVLILCLYGALNFFVMAKYRVLLTADQSAYCISLSSVLQLLLNMALIVLMLKLGLPGSDSILIVRGVALLSVVSCAATLALITRKKYGKIDFYAKPNKKALEKRNAALLLQVFGIIQNSAPTVILTSIVGLSIVSVYSVYNMVAGTITTCIAVFTSGLASNFGNIKASGEEKLLEATTEQYRVSVFTLGTVLYSVMMIMILPFVSIYTEGINDVNYILPALGILITVKGLVFMMRSPYGMLVFSFGKYREVNPYLFCQTMTAIVLSLLFSWLWGLNGIVTALIISEIFMLIVMLFFTRKHLIKISVKRELFRLTRIAATVALTYGLSRFIPYTPNTWASWLIYAVIAVLAVSCITLLINFPFEKNIYKAIAKRVKTYITLKFGERKGAN